MLTLAITLRHQSQTSSEDIEKAYGTRHFVLKSDLDHAQRRVVTCRGRIAVAPPLLMRYHFVARLF